MDIEKLIALVPSNEEKTRIMEAYQDDTRRTAPVEDRSMIQKFIEVLRENLGVLSYEELSDHTKTILPEYIEKLFDIDNWSSVDYQAPAKDVVDNIRTEVVEAGGFIVNPYGGTDMMINIFENDEWGRNDMGFRFQAITEFGRVIAFRIQVDFESEFLF